MKTRRATYIGPVVPDGGPFGSTVLGIEVEYPGKTTDVDWGDWRAMQDLIGNLKPGDAIRIGESGAGQAVEVVG